MRSHVHVCGQRGGNQGALRVLSLVIAALVSLGSIARSVVAQESGVEIDGQVVIAALTEIDGWLRTDGMPYHATVTYTFDEALGHLRTAGGSLVRAATGDSNRWARSVDNRTGCPRDASAPGCPSQSTDPVVTLGEILRLPSGLYSVQFTLSRPPKDTVGDRAAEVRLFRMRKLADGRFVRDGGIGLLIP